MTGTDRTVDSEETAEEPGTRAQRHFWGLRVKLRTALVHTRRPGLSVCAGDMRGWAWARSRAIERWCRRAELTVLNYDRGPIERNPFVATPDPPVSAGSECRGRRRPRRGLNGGSLQERSWLPCCDEHGGTLGAPRGNGYLGKFRRTKCPEFPLLRGRAVFPFHEGCPVAEATRSLGEEKMNGVFLSFIFILNLFGSYIAVL